MPVQSARPADTLTRRDFLWRVSRFGGAAVLGSMFALDLLGRDAGVMPPLGGRAPVGQGRRVLILGGGLSGLSTAYELGKLGYECVMLEARARPGGRNWTIRRGTEETEIGGGATGFPAGERQMCKFDDGLFVNGGPMRISHHHATTLGYCREFGIPLVVFPNINEAAYVHREGLPKMRLREVEADLRGYTSELLAKVVKKGQLDAPLSADDREKLIEYLRAEGRLDPDFNYPRTGGGRDDPSEFDNPRGYVSEPGVAEDSPRPTAPLDLEVLIKAGYGYAARQAEIYTQQPTMLTPAGGIDRIPYAFAERLGGVVRYRAEVREIRRAADGGVRVAYADAAQGGAVREATADFCVCALPPALLARLPADFSPEASAALQLMQPGAAGKIGLQFKRRFWEEDDGIYGGVSRTNLPIGQIYYPFDNYGSKGKGVVLGYYNYGKEAADFGDQPPAGREKRALEQGAKIHPQYPAEFENSFSIAWRRVPHSEMAWVEFNEEAHYDQVQRVLGRADGPFYFAGDWRTHMNAWMAGAFASAHQVCRDLHARANAG